MDAIETEYNGYRFRSRLEARWAVFFDNADLTYKYEPEGFDTGEYGYYLPDFWLGHYIDGLFDDGWGFWVEIKPTTADNIEVAKLQAVCVQTGHNGLLLQGDPYPDEFEITKVQVTHLDNPRLMPEYHPFWLWIGKLDDNPRRKQLERAYKAARQARFEHGQVGPPSEWM